MKRTVLVAVIALASVLAFTNVHSDAEMVEATSQISGVTVFMDAGLVKRAATADVKAGYSLVKVSGLPRWVSSNNTIVRGSGDFTLISTEFRTLWKKDAPTKQIETLLKEKDELLAKLEEHSITLKVLEQEESVYKSLAPSAISANELPDELKQLSAEDSQKLLDTVEKGLTSVYERKLENDIAVRELNDKLRVVNQQLKELGASKVYYNEALVAVRAKSDVSIALELTSLTGGCGWSTAYDARLQENGKLSLSYFANVKQRTSEDWEGVEMSLSTNSIAAVALPPELKKVAIALVDKVQKAEDKAKVQRPRTSRGFDNAAPSESARPEAETRSYGGGMSVEFKLPSTASVPGDGSNRRLLVKNLEFDAGLEYESLPRLRQDAFARFEVVNRHDFPLMAGPLRAFSGGEYLGKTNIDTVASGEKFKLYFGADKRIEVKYRQIKRKKSEGWWSKTVDFEWAIKFKNHSPEKVRINVIDAMPKLGNDELSLKSVKFSPKPVNDFEKDENRLVKWMIELDPGEEMEITVSFEVKGPDDEELIWSGPWEGGVK